MLDKQLTHVLIPYLRVVIGFLGATFAWTGVLVLIGPGKIRPAIASELIAAALLYWPLIPPLRQHRARRAELTSAANQVEPTTTNHADLAQRADTASHTEPAGAAHQSSLTQPEPQRRPTAHSMPVGVKIALTLATALFILTAATTLVGENSVLHPTTHSTPG